jgi:hypothetical protein
MEILILNTSTQIKTLLIKADLSVNENTWYFMEIFILNSHINFNNYNKKKFFNNLERRKLDNSLTITLVSNQTSLKLQLHEQRSPRQIYPRQKSRCTIYKIFQKKQQSYMTGWLEETDCKCMYCKGGNHNS